MTHIRHYIDLVENVLPRLPLPPSFNLRGVYDDLIYEMNQGIIVRTEDYIEKFNSEIEDYGGEEMDDIEEEPWRDPRFRQFLKDTIMAELNYLRTGKPIRAWRAIVANADWTPETAGRHIGRHWTNNKRLAIPYDHNEGTHLYVIEAILPDSSIDWTETVSHHLTRDDEEDEITIEDNAPVQIVKVTKKRFKG